MTSDVDDLMKLARILAKMYVRRVGEHVTYEDLRADAEYGVAIALQTYSADRGTTLRTWAAMCARREIIEGIRRGARRNGTESLSDRTPIDYDRDPLLDRVLREAIQALPERERTMILMYYFADRDYREICKVLGISVGSFGYFRKHSVGRLQRQLRVSTGDSTWSIDSMTGHRPRLAYEDCEDEAA